MSENELHVIPWLGWFSGVGDLWLLPIFPISGLAVRVSGGKFTIHLMSQHPLVFGVQFLIEAIPLHLLYMPLLDPSWILQLEYLDLLWQVHSKFSQILPWSLLEGTELLAQGVKCHHHGIMLIQCLEDVILGCVLTKTTGKVSWEPLQWQDYIWQQMLVIPTGVAENSYVPLPQVVSQSVFSLFVLEGWQIDLHSKTPSCPCRSAAFSWHCHYSWMKGTLIASPISTPTPRGGWTTRGVCRKLWPSLPSVLHPTSTSKLRMSIPLLMPVINCIALSHLPFGSIFFQAPHPLFDVICSCRGPCYLDHSVGTSWPPCLSSLFHNSFHDGFATFLYSLHGCLHLSCHTSLSDGASQAESYIPYISQGEPFLAWSSSKE